MLYCEAYLDVNPGIAIRPSIYKVKELTAQNFSDALKISEGKNNDLRLEDFQMIRKEFVEGLKGSISAIFSPEEPFRMTRNINKCGYCPYRALCQR
jgi:hypothetical protein